MSTGGDRDAPPDALAPSPLATAHDVAFLRSVLAAVPAFIIHADAELSIRFVNRYQPGLTPELVIGRSVFDFVAQADHEHTRRCIAQARATGEPVSYVTVAPGPHGTPATYETTVAPVREPDGSLGICLIATDVTRQRERDRELLDSESKLRVALEATGIGLWSWEIGKGKPIWDERMCALHGLLSSVQLDEYIGRLVHPEDREAFGARVDRLLEQGRWQFDTEGYRIVRPDGAVRWLTSRGRVEHDEQGAPRRVVGGTLDVTEQRLLEDHLRQSQKLEAIGSLTAGVAHNFNNMLSVILPSLEIAARSLPPDRAPLLKEASHAAKRAAELVQQLMTYAGQSRAYERATHALDEVVEAAVSICRRVFDASVQLDARYARPVPAVSCNPVQLEQALVNILLNARDAVLAQDQERRLVAIRVSAAAAPPDSDGEPGEGVVIEIEDNGIGMSEEVRARAFEPFFSTKGTGRGTGLGLATSFAIVRDHGGRLSCRSTPGRGSIFRIGLPVSTQAPVPVVAARRVVPSRRLRVLVVDDDDAVRTTLERILSDAGLRVTCADDGEAGVARLAADPGVDVVLLDRSMPGGPGERFIARMRAAAPKTRILFLSGQSVEPEVAALADGVVAKPATADVLLDALHRVTR